MLSLSLVVLLLSLLLSFTDNNVVFIMIVVIRVINIIIIITVITINITITLKEIRTKIIEQISSLQLYSMQCASRFFSVTSGVRRGLPTVFNWIVGRAPSDYMQGNAV